MTHSTAPWKLEIDNPTPGDLYDDGTPVPVWLWLWNAEHNGVVVCDPDNTPTRRADYTLFSAAPELLEACKALIEEAGLQDPFNDEESRLVLEQARAAILKAEGAQ